MPSGPKLTDLEKGQIIAYKQQGLSYRAISRKINRSDKVVRYYLADTDNYGTKTSPGRPSKLSARDKRKIIKNASNTAKSCRKIGSDCSLEVSKWTIWRVFDKANHLKSIKLKKIPKLEVRHKTARVKFAREWSKHPQRWEKVK
jgi:transposase